MPNSMKVYIHSQEKTLYEGTADVVTLPAESGDISVLAYHVPLITSLKAGAIVVGSAREAEKRVFRILGGFAQIELDTVRVLVTKS